MLYGLATAYQLATLYNRTLCIEWNDFRRVFRSSTTCASGGHTMQYWDFGTCDSREALHARAKSHDRTVRLEANRVLFPLFRVPQYFDSICAPMVNTSISNVAHLRAGVRRGIFLRSGAWQLLSRCIPPGTYILSDGTIAARKLRGFVHAPHIQHVAHGLSISDLRETWRQWCTIRSAATVYHTPSGFSESALFWGYAHGVLLSAQQCAVHVDL
jgi:hypothetical protein